MKYRPDIDGLRAVAIILVLLFHGFPDLMPGGFIGVDIFFVISGYLISGIIFENLKNGIFTFSHFYARRILRIFPALTLLITCCLLAGMFLLSPADFKSLGAHALSGACFFANILLYTETGYFDNAAYAKPLLNLWSLGIEEQFYIFFPLIMWLCWRYYRKLALVLAILMLLSFADNIFLFKSHPEADFYLPLSRFWELLAGACLQAIQKRQFQRPWRLICAFSGVICIILALIFCSMQEGQYPGYIALMPIAGSILLIAAGADNFFNRTALANPVSIFIGKISYSLYLWHWPLLSFAFIRLGSAAYQDATLLRSALILAAFPLAALTWKFVENPFRFGRPGKSLGVPILACAGAFVACSGAFIFCANGFMPWVTSADREICGSMLQPDQRDEECRRYIGMGRESVEYCRFNNIGSSRTVALLGDSHALSAYEGLAELGTELGFNTLLLGRFPDWPRPDRPEPADTANALRALAERKEIEKVLVVIRGPSYMYETHNRGDRVRQEFQRISYEELSKLMQSVIDQLISAGKEVILVEDNPDLEIDMRDILSWRNFRTEWKRDYTPTKKADVLARHKDFMRMQKELAAQPGVTLLAGTLDAFCPEDDCELFDEQGLPLYYDDDHLSGSGSRKLAREILMPYFSDLDKKSAGAGS